MSSDACKFNIVFRGLNVDQLKSNEPNMNKIFELEQPGLNLCPTINVGTKQLSWNSMNIHVRSRNQDSFTIHMTQKTI